MRGYAEQAYGSLLRVLTAGRGVRWEMAPGVTVRIDPRCRWIRNPSYEAPVVEYLRSRIRPGDCCFDVGAHVGYYVLQMALWTAPEGRIVAFEPNPTAREVLKANVRMNGLDARVTVEPCAVAAARGTAALFHGGETSGLSRIGAPNPFTHNSGSLNVDVVSLDDYVASTGATPQWVLIDAEGVELEILDGAGRLLDDPRTSFVVELHPVLWDHGDRGREYLDALLRRHRRHAVPLTEVRDPAGYKTIALVCD